MGLGKEVEEWGKFLDSEKLTQNKNALILTMEILAAKVCCESILTSEQVAILKKTKTVNFISTVETKLGKILESFVNDTVEEEPMLFIQR